jgi:hypothetical protein
MNMFMVNTTLKKDLTHKVSTQLMFGEQLMKNMVSKLSFGSMSKICNTQIL